MEIDLIDMVHQVVGILERCRMDHLRHNFLVAQEDRSPVAQLVMILEGMFGIDLVLLCVVETGRVIETGIENEGLLEKGKGTAMAVKKKVESEKVVEIAEAVERKKRAVVVVAAVKVGRGVDQGHHVLGVMKRKVDLLQENE